MAFSEDTPIKLAASSDDYRYRDTHENVSVLEEIDKLYISQLPPYLQSTDKEDLKRKYSKAKSISILVTGKTGSGKSTLINGILGLDVKGQAKEGHDLKACTTKVEVYQGEKGEISAKVWDSPGLQDGTENQDEYIKQMKENCSNGDLTIYCIKISDRKPFSGSDEVRAMKKLTEAFGHDFWKTTIIVLTFANSYQLIDTNWNNLDDQEKPLVYERKIQQWRERIRESLTNNINVPDEIVRAIRIVPAGHYREPHLPGYKFWLSNLWLHCISNAKSIYSVLVTGKTGSGKSTLINGMLGLNVKEERQAKEGHDLKACTTKVEAYRVKNGKITAIVWDSPGLEDGTENQDEYIKQMKEKCSNRDLTIYCIRISDTRLVSGSDEVRAMKKLTKAFGHDFWKTTIIVLTFANSYQVINKDWDDLDDQEKPLVYERKNTAMEREDTRDLD